MGAAQEVPAQEADTAVAIKTPYEPVIQFIISALIYCNFNLK